MITNWKYVREYESSMAKYLGVKEAVAVSSATTGLLLTLKCLDLEGEVILPSFTFSVSGHVLEWNNLTPVFVDIDPETCLIDPQEVEKAITPKTCAILGVHIWGNPCAADQLQEIADRHGLELIFDAAQATGSRYLEKPVGGFGRAEVFSCSPTKVVTSGEGGIIATNDEEFAKKLRVGRNYGDDGSYDCDFAGINARMSEFNAVLGLASLEMSNDNIKRRLELFGMYESRLGKLPGINFPKTTPGGTVNGVYFTIIIDQDSFGLTRDQLYTALKSENVDTRKYYYPALHQQTVNSGLTAQYEGKLPVTDYMSANTLTLPMFSHMTDEEASGVCDAVERLQENAETVRGNWKEIEAKVTK
jgi:dTDP-4-amino-4,6-dideoxygalactose transaminase